MEPRQIVEFVKELSHLALGWGGQPRHQSMRNWRQNSSAPTALQSLIDSDEDVPAQPTTPRPARSRMHTSGSPSRGGQKASLAPTKVLLLGQSGAGKSTLINYFTNYYRGPRELRDWADLRIMVPTKHIKTCTEKESSRNTEADVDDDSKGQTQKPFTYVFNRPGRGPMNIIDTPGLADPKGADTDEEHLKAVLELVMGIAEFNAIVLVVNGTQCRLDATMKTVCAKLQSAIAKDFYHSMVAICTKCDDTSCLWDDQKLRREFGFPIKKMFTMENSVFAKPEPEDEGLRRRLIAKYKESMEACERIETVLDELPPVSTAAFKKLKKERALLKESLAEALLQQGNLQRFADAMEIQQMEEEAFKKQMNIHKGRVKQVVKVDQLEWVKTPSEKHTVCLSCTFLCHKSCTLRELPKGSHEFSSCYAFHDESRGEASKCCKQCGSGTCTADSHCHMKQYPKMVSKDLESTNAAVLKKYLEAQEQMTSKQKAQATLQTQQVMVKDSLNQQMDKIKKACRNMRNLCPSYNFSGEMAAVIQGMEAQKHTLTSEPLRTEAEARIKHFKEFAEKMEPSPKRRWLTLTG